MRWPSGRREAIGTRPGAAGRSVPVAAPASAAAGVADRIPSSVPTAALTRRATPLILAATLLGPAAATVWAADQASAATRHDIRRPAVIKALRMPGGAGRFPVGPAAAPQSLPPMPGETGLSALADGLLPGLAGPDRDPAVGGPPAGDPGSAESGSGSTDPQQPPAEPATTEPLAAPQHSAAGSGPSGAPLGSAVGAAGVAADPAEPAAGPGITDDPGQGLPSAGGVAVTTPPPSSSPAAAFPSTAAPTTAPRPPAPTAPARAPDGGTALHHRPPPMPAPRLDLTARGLVVRPPAQGSSGSQSLVPDAAGAAPVAVVPVAGPERPRDQVAAYIPARRVLPLGAGLALIGLGLGFLGIRLRRQ